MVPFPQHELQGKWVARVLSGRARLPARAAMDAAVAEHAAQLAARGAPTRHATLLQIRRQQLPCGADPRLAPAGDVRWFAGRL